MNSKQNTLSRVSQIMIYATVATWVKWQSIEGVIIYRIMIICTYFHSNPMLFSDITEDSTFFVCWCNEQLSSVSRTFPSEVPIRRFLIRSTSVRRSSDSSTQELHRMMVINYKDDFFLSSATSSLSAVRTLTFTCS